MKTFFGSFFLLVSTLVHVQNVRQPLFRLIKTNSRFVAGVKSRFLVSDKYCHIPNLPPFNTDASRLFRTISPYQCNSRQWKWTVLDQSTNGSYVIYIRVNPQKTYSGNFFCSYATITRPTNIKNPDDHYKISAYKTFKNYHVLSHNTEFVLVKCFTKKKYREKIFYFNGHTMVPSKAPVKARLEKFHAATSTPTYSVIILGIDSLSRLNMHRSMPKTMHFLKSHNWIEFFGFNKVAENTYPNLIALLTGYNDKDSKTYCQPERSGGLEKCPLLFQTFVQAGYVTNYAEDQTPVSTFNYLKRGFKHPPTDYYMRPFLQACEDHLKNYVYDNFYFCLGPKSTTGRVLGYANQFFEQYQNQPKFGLFWLNNFSHQNMNHPQKSDTEFSNWLLQFENSGLYEDSFVFLMGDHGFRRAPFVDTNAGWLEDRLPVLYVHVPKSFAHNFPREMKDLMLNQRRLVTVFDIYFTVLDVLIKSGRNVTRKKSRSCKDCHSLFKPISKSRSCTSVPIDAKWCACNACDVFKKKPTLKNLKMYCP